ncbi:hypothetical protein GCM10009841_31390 [Microlunatus panaciterrae]|uniref:AbiEi antitoxin N-terminal domain-containing protein n=1 Tax=Microlunatus panaciterrae TaxID=400768 RepID=A0ABS2RFL8_9ACTN|nr:type IV toxin-antitoxin system AbiEi family antitoxin domain-containing protein [Microlunatus panaciterrae]MBM7797799.1 hypothetical protein [Microlunatus panaciterrae]
MTEPILSSDLLAQGYSRDEVRRMHRRGELVRLRRGAYLKPESEPPAARDRHLQLVRATLPQVSEAAVVSHVSAAVLHGLPVWTDSLDRVHLTRDRSSGGRRASGVHVHTAPLPTDEVVQLDGIRVTSLARTVVDLGRSQPYERAVAAGDRALAGGLDPADLDEAMGRARHRPGMASARRAVAFLDPRSESPGESLSRVTLAQLGLMPTELQLRIVGGDGRLVARTDFGWREHRTVGEFDGRIKYGRLLSPGQSLEDVLFKEKLREDALRDLGWEVVRWVWADLYRPEVIAERLRRAFTRASR